MNSTLKRKARSDDEDDQPRKLPAIAEEGDQPLRPSRTAPNVAPTRVLPARKATQLTVPKAPTLASATTRRATRATSAPPKNEPVRPLPRPAPNRVTVTRPAPATRAAANRAAPTARPTAGPSTARRGAPTREDERFQVLQEQLTAIEAARAADAERLAADMDTERAKLAELQANHLALSRELANAKTQELEKRRELMNASDELEQMKRRHANEVMDLEMDIKKKEREIRELREDLRIAQGDLERERDTVATLKTTISQQSTAQLALTSQVDALQAQLSALQTTLDQTCNDGTHLQAQLERERRRIAELEEETLKAETLRRKLHNMVQELKAGHHSFPYRYILT